MNAHSRQIRTDHRMNLAAVGGALSGLLFGFDTAVISGTTTALSQIFHLDPIWLGITVSAALWGTLVGALVAGIPGDRFGSRDVLKVVALLFLVGALGSALSWGWTAFICFRLLTGIAVGGASVLAPVYLSELAPAERRGRTVVLFQLNIIAGILLAYFSNAVIARMVTSPDAWRWEFAMGAMPAALLIVVLMGVPNSPRWLIANGRADAATRILAGLGRSQSEAQRETATIQAAFTNEPAGERLSWSRHAKPITLAILVALFNQLSGINALLYYTNDIFASAGGNLSPDLQAIAIGAANAVFTCLGLVLIDRAGRKVLLVVGSVGMAVCLAVAGMALSGQLPRPIVLAALIGFIAFFASSTGAVIWVYLSEIFPTAVRSRGSALGASVHWAANAVIAAIFPVIAAKSIGLPFFIFAGAMLAQSIVVSRLFPETRGVSLERIGEQMRS